MDLRNARAVGALCVALLGFGCNQATNSQGDIAQKDSTGSTTLVGPDQVVAEFLEAVRVGDDQKAAQLLTPLARKKTADMEMVVAPPGSDTAKFQVQEVELIGEGAHVATDWTDLDTDGRPHTDRIVWIMRQETEGWRIAGMATRVFAEQEPIILNFEDPADMLRRQQLAEEELARRSGQQSQAKNPATEDGPNVR